MKQIGLGGGIGSGKTNIAKAFEALGIPVYYADTEARRLMETDKIKNKIIETFNDRLFIGGKLNKPKISELIFNDDDARQKINNIVHPAVHDDFNLWSKNQDYDIVMIEAAILFETGFYKTLNANILILADEAERIERIKNRDKSERESVIRRIKSQQKPENFINLATFLIYNNNKDEVLPQVLKIFNTLINNG